MHKIFLHMGLHKTATGTLQRQFFPACNNLQLLTTIIPEAKAFFELVTRKDPIYFDPERARSLVNSTLSREKPNLLSNESLSGPPYAGVLEYGLDHRSSVIANLKAVFPHAKVILVLRRQDALARSLYRQYLKSGGTRSVRRFYGVNGDGRLPLISLDRFSFAPYVDLLKNAFHDGVLILAFEEFKEKQESFLRKVTDFVGIECPDIRLRKENATRLGPLGMELTRILNHLFRSHLNPAGVLPGVPLWRKGRIRSINPVELLHDKWPGRGSRGKGEVDNVAREILKMVQEDNRVLDQKYGLALHQYGYYGDPASRKQLTTVSVRNE